MWTKPSVYYCRDVPDYRPSLCLGCFGIRQYVADFTSEIDRLRWLGGQQLEQTAMGQHFVAPRVAVSPADQRGIAGLILFDFILA